jgi:hypothetical protein
LAFKKFRELSEDVFWWITVGEKEIYYGLES